MDVSSDDGSAKSPALRVPNASPSACVDMAVMQADHERGVCSNSANLTFAPADFLDNNNLPAVACPSGKISGHHGDPGRWRPSDKTAGSAGDDPSDAGAKQLGPSRPLRGGAVDSYTARRCLVEAGAEFVATSILMFVGCAGCYVDLTGPSTDAIHTSSFALAVFMSIVIFGEVSGAHMNPLVTMMNVAVSDMWWVRGGVYVAAQLAGGFAGYGLLQVVVPGYVKDVIRDATRDGGVCCTVPLISMTPVSTALGELAATCILLSAVCTFVARPAPNHSVAVQFTVLVFGLSYLEGPYTGASMNPMRSFVPAVWTGVWDQFWVYLVAQVAAFVIVAAVFSLCRSKPKRD